MVVVGTADRPCLHSNCCLRVQEDGASSRLHCIGPLLLELLTDEKAYVRRCRQLVHLVSRLLQGWQLSLQLVDTAGVALPELVLFKPLLLLDRLLSPNKWFKLVVSKQARK